MKKLFGGLLLAATILTPLTPAFARPDSPRGHAAERGDRSGGHRGPAARSSGNRSEARPAPPQARPQAPRPQVRQQVQRARPEARRPDPRPQIRQQAQRTRSDPRVQVRQQARTQPQAQRGNRDWGDRNRGDNRNWGDRNRGNDRNWNDNRNRNDNRNWDRDRNNNRNWDRNRNDNRRWDRDRNDRRNWSRDWRRDQRYNWQSYRNAHRSHYRLPRYYSPYRNRSYTRFSIGFTLGSLFYSERYWINDPWYYRLPPAYGNYRWVRYYDDALLVDVYSGQVVDVIYDFFW